MLYITLACVLIILFSWITSTQKSFLALDENVNNSIAQIGIQISSYWDALGSLLCLLKTYDPYVELVSSEALVKRRIITKDSSMDDIIAQEHIIEEVLILILGITERNPKLKMNKTYVETLDAISQYKKMVYTSRLIYNDSVTKFNCAITLFPAIIVAGILGFSKRGYLDLESRN